MLSFAHIKLSNRLVMICRCNIQPFLFQPDDITVISVLRGKMDRVANAPLELSLSLTCVIRQYYSSTE